jgi:hypothetical protein
MRAMVAGKARRGATAAASTQDNHGFPLKIHVVRQF